MADQLVGQSFGGYEFLEELGRGGMAVVYKARQVSMNRMVAVKVLPRQFAHDKTFRARFEREMDIVKNLEHRAIVPVHDSGEIEDMPYIVMRYMDAGSVDDLLRHGPLAPKTVERIVRQIGDGLDHAHSRGILHRDLKPSNILMDETGGAYLTDFGIAHLSGSSAITTEGVVGTPAYMSPEQAQGLKLDGRSDVYGLAVVTYEMLAARRPYEGDTPYSIAVMHVTAPVPSIREANPSLSQAVDKVLQRGLAKNRVERYQTAAAFADALSRAVHASPAEIEDSAAQTKPIDLTEAHRKLEQAEQVLVSAPRRPAEGTPSWEQPVTPPSSKPVVVKARRGRPWWLNVLLGGALGLIFFLLIAVLGLMALNGDSPPPTNTATATTNGAGVTVVPSLAPLHPAAQAMTATAQAADPVDPLGELAQRGGRIVFYAERNGEDAELYLLDLSTGLEQPLTDNDDSDIYPSVSPDGMQVAFMSDRDGDYDIYVMALSCLDSANGTADCEASARQLTRNSVEDRTPSWTPDGSTLLFGSDIGFNGQFNLYSVDTDGRNLQRLTNSTTRDGHPSMSPDGRYIVYHSWQVDDPETGEILRLTVDTGDIVTLVDSTGNDWAPTYSPDGRTIVFNRRGEDSRASLWLVDADGRNMRRLEDSEGYDWASAWSPDGQLLAFTSDREGEQDLYLIAATGGEVRRITTGGGEYPSWVP